MRQTVFLPLLVAVTAGSLSAQVTLVREGDVWSFYRAWTAPPADWADPDFEPAAAGWEAGPTGIGYGDDDDATVLDNMQGNYVSVYLRTDIEVPAEAAGLVWTLRARYDDGFVAYIDGDEVARRGLTGVPPPHDELAESHDIIDPFGFDEDIPLPRASGLLTAGPHTLAVEVHNTTLNSSDLSFSAELSGAAFVVTSIDPAFGPLEGGNVVAMEGLGFDEDDVPQVLFGNSPATDVDVQSGSTLEVTAPAADRAGPVDITVEDSRGQVVVPGGYTYALPGRVGLRFDGDQHATAASLGNVTTEGTFEIWFTYEPAFFGFGSRVPFGVEAPGGGNSFFIDVRDGRIRARAFGGGEEDRLTAGVPVSTGEWHHLAFSFSPAGRTLLLDGVVVARDSSVMQLPFGARVRLGQSFGNSTALAGEVATFRVWGVARGVGEIQRYPYAWLDDAPGLESAWYLSEGSGNLAANAGPAGSPLVFGDSTGPDGADPQWAVLDAFPALAVAAIEPDSGPRSGGNVVRIYGTGFAADATEVFFGFLDATEVTVTDAWELEAVVPPGDAYGAVRVSVRSPAGTVLVDGAYRYEPDEIRTVVREGDLWHYFVSPLESPPPVSWDEPDFDPAAAGWEVGPTGIGYGDGDDATDVSWMAGDAAAVYARIEWQLPSKPSAVEVMRFRIRYDDGYVAYLNGEEISRMNLVGTPPDNDELATSHDITVGAGEFDEEIDVSEHLPLLEPRRNVLAVQIHNTTLGSSDLSMSAELVIGGTLTPEGALFMRGDVDGSEAISVTDCVRILRSLFAGASIDCEEAADSDDDGSITVTDAVYLFDFVFRGGPAPLPPFPEEDYDLDDDPLDCGP